jgi:hypothetical protein
MSDFLDVAADLLHGRRVEDSRVQFEAVFRAVAGLQQVHSKAQLDLNNIESIFTALELGKVIQRVPGLELAEISPAIASLKKLIVRTIEKRMPFPVTGTTLVAPEPYPNFAKLVHRLTAEVVPRKSVAVLTFNYDLAIDVALYRAGLGPSYVIDSDPPSPHSIELLKLHGSLNWASESEGGRIRPLHMHHYLPAVQIYPGADQETFELPVGSQLQSLYQVCTGEPVLLEPEAVIVPPSWNKADHHGNLSPVWAAAAGHLSQAEHVFICGYSLPETDAFFRHLFALGSVGPPLRQLVVYNPDTSVDAKFRNLLGPGAQARYRFCSYTFSDAIGHIRGMFPKADGR